MQIKDLTPKQGNVDIVIDILEVQEPREFQKFGKAGKVANATAKDETGEVKLTLWNDDVEKYKAGDRVHLTNGYVNEWQGELQLTTGRMGKMEIVGKADSPSESASEPKEEVAVEESIEDKPTDSDSNAEEVSKDPDEEKV
jgi:replication factor A1